MACPDAPVWRSEKSGIALRRSNVAWQLVVHINPLDVFLVRGYFRVIFDETMIIV
jgi:hypothetical protein